ncbi:hypothetical protein GCM10007938_04090 [Vibrio zhanjiangensis]|uniref:LemA family protein n=1 Tax=Vibrio zhanjiangensis TaxID=1046128 RepID=A0ABQ6EU03_9VIBR|nr:hypothetical protein [Vibrio zhanjiangensis]GLT16633.1 hypothetical protein GCM10007938_04090 [Vibrio zhanjiangensis]
MLARFATIVQLVLALSIFYLGYTIHQVTKQASVLVESYPEIIADIDSLAKTLQVEDWLKVIEAAEKMVPSVVNSVDQVSQSVAAVNQTASSIDAKLPMVLEELTRYRLDVFPVAVDEAASYRKDIIPFVIAESEGYRHTTIPLLIQESANLRSEIPPMLAKADEIVEQSQQLAEQATSGAVKGVIMSPINIIKDAGSKIKGKIILEEEETETPQPE